MFDRVARKHVTLQLTRHMARRHDVSATFPTKLRVTLTNYHAFVTGGTAILRTARLPPSARTTMRLDDLRLPMMLGEMLSEPYVTTHPKKTYTGFNRATRK